MTKFFAALLLTAVAWAGALTDVRAQSAVLDGQTREEAQAGQATRKKARQRGKASADDIANMQRRMSMNAEETKRDQQRELLEARAGVGGGNSSLSRAAGPDRQYDRGTGGFTVRKFKDKRVGARPPQRGQMRPSGYVNPKGKPLSKKQKGNANRRKKHFLFF